MKHEAVKLANDPHYTFMSELPEDKEGLKIVKSKLRQIFEVIIKPCFRNSQKHESTLLHTYVLNEFLTADRSLATKYF